ncbi:hypothetical protein [Arthrobacter cryoconiti]|uniref:Uncharacterized protein n=1 Tax=Arthrobacter cryoconiti TaxID=748907 RepID=A0ABV8QWJ3_9MICC|nr:hypothetical protein [Arthrobacter cryoconiti]MCC9068824.1 hypothetical protein [Arthrobacter cryoconiti]
MAEAEEKDRRFWAKIDVDYFDNSKIDELSDAGQLLHLGLILKAKKQQKGGVLSARLCKARGDAALKELMDGDLIHKMDARTYQLHDYGKHQTDDANISETRSKIGQKGAHKTNHENRQIYVEICGHCQQAASDGEEWLKHAELGP